MNLSFIQPSVTFSSCTIYQLATGAMASNCYLLEDKETSGMVIIDPGDDPEYIVNTVTQLEGIPMAIVATHGHFDHILGGFTVQHTFPVPFYLNPKDRFLLDRMQESARHFLGVRLVDPPPTITHDLLPGNEIRFGKTILSSFSTPGHTPGSMTLTVKGCRVLFVGDVLFADGGTGRTDQSYGDRSALISSITQILSFPPDTIILSGHGGQTTVQQETKYNNASSL